MSEQQEQDEIILTIKLPLAVQTLAALAKHIRNEHGDDVIMWENPEGMLNFGKHAMVTDPTAPTNADEWRCAVCGGRDVTIQNLPRLNGKVWNGKGHCIECGFGVLATIHQNRVKCRNKVAPPITISKTNNKHK